MWALRHFSLSMPVRSLYINLAAYLLDCLLAFVLLVFLGGKRYTICLMFLHEDVVLGLFVYSQCALECHDHFFCLALLALVHLLSISLTAEQRTFKRFCLKKNAVVGYEVKLSLIRKKMVGLPF